MPVTNQRPVARLRLAKPLATAYILGLLSSTAPRMVKILLLLVKRKLGLQAALLQIRNVLRQALSPHRFPTFCAVLIGGSTLLQIPIRGLMSLLLHTLKATATPLEVRRVRQISRLFAALISASVSFKSLNSAPSNPRSQSTTAIAQPSSHLEFMEPGPFDEPPETGTGEVDDATLNAKALSRTDLAGRTMDLTLFAVIRALDIVISDTWNRLPLKRTSALKSLAKFTPTALFSFSAATIMHAWFYSPSRLPHSYNTWISAAAELDQRLILALRHARYGTFIYGKDTGMAPLLGSMCRDYGMPEECGDPAKTIPVPCELVHMGQGKNCEKHALLRFWRGWIFAAKMYAPLQLIVLARKIRAKRRPGDTLLQALNKPDFIKAFIDMSRSSAFLGAFISLFYYGVCLSRTRLGPKLFSSKTITPQMWDSGLCVLGGCLLCGSSILVEQSRKRLEILFFVLPRAAATWFPRLYLPENRWREHVAFAVSAAIVLTAAQEDPGRVRGVLGGVLGGVLKM